MTVVFDSSVWISAIRFGGIARLAIEKAAASATLAISSEIEAETRNVLIAKLGYTRREAIDITTAAFAHLQRVSVTGSVAGVCRDPNDDHVLECAQRANADVIVSGDKDLLALGRFEDIHILTVRQYLDLPQS